METKRLESILKNTSILFEINEIVKATTVDKKTVNVLFVVKIYFWLSVDALLFRYATSSSELA